MAKKKVGPQKLWMLWNVDSKCWGIAFDDPPNSAAYLCSLSEKDARKLCDHQLELYDIRCYPVRVI